jgi:hypothetical protein
MKCCLITLMIYGFERTNVSAIKRSAEEHWPFEKWDSRGRLRASGRDALDGNLNEAEFVDRLSSAIWRANGTFCFITIVISREYTLGEADYAKLTGKDSLPS